MSQAAWFYVTNCKKDIPKHTCYVGNCCDVWVWVAPENRTEFTAFTLAILDIANASTARVITAAATGTTINVGTKPEPPEIVKKGAPPLPSKTLARENPERFLDEIRKHEEYQAANAEYQAALQNYNQRVQAAQSAELFQQQQQSILSNRTSPISPFAPPP